MNEEMSKEVMLILRYSPSLDDWRKQATMIGDSDSEDEGYVY